MREDSKKYVDPFAKTNIASLVGSISSAERVMGVYVPGEQFLKDLSQVAQENMSFVVRYPEYTRDI